MEANDPNILLHKYLQNSLNAEEQKAFDRLRQNDPPFGEEVEAAIFIAARHRLDAKKRWLGLVSKNRETKNTATIRHLYLPWMAVAATLLLVAGVAYFLWPAGNVNEFVAEQLSEHYPSPVVVMGEEELAEKDWRAAVKAYQEGRYELAVPLLEKLVSEKPGDPEFHFYLGLSYLYMPEPNAQKAIAYFENAKQLDTVKYGEQSDWYVALAWLWLGEQERAVPILEQIEKRGGWKSREAGELLKLK